MRVEKREFERSGTLVPDKPPNQAICFQDIGFLLPAGNARIDRDIGNARGGQCRVYLARKFLKILEDLSGRFPRIEVIRSCIENDHLWLIGKDDALRITHTVGDLGTAKTAIDDAEFGKVLCQC